MYIGVPMNHAHGGPIKPNTFQLAILVQPLNMTRNGLQQNDHLSYLLVAKVT